MRRQSGISSSPLKLEDTGLSSRLIDSEQPRQNMRTTACASVAQTPPPLPSLAPCGGALDHRRGGMDTAGGGAISTCPRRYNIVQALTAPHLLFTRAIEHAGEGTPGLLFGSLRLAVAQAHLSVLISDMLITGPLACRCRVASCTGDSAAVRRSMTQQSDQLDSAAT